MSRKKSTVKEEVIKSDVVICVEDIIGQSINAQGNNGSDYTKSIFSQLQREGHTVEIIKYDEAPRTVELQIIVLPGTSKFSAVVVRKGKVTLSPGAIVTKDTQYQVVSRYEITNPAKVSKPIEVPAPEVSDE